MATTAHTEFLKSVLDIGTSLLWYAIEKAKGNSPHVTLWDVFPNARTGSEAWRKCASSLLDSIRADTLWDNKTTEILHAVAGGHLVPDSDYQVCSCSRLVELYHNRPFDLIYSQPSLEYAWGIQDTWDALCRAMAVSGWHSHRIDLADHGRRESNFIEMLEWPEWAYQLTMRLITGAINRWRVSQYIGYLRELGFDIINEKRQVEPRLPIEWKQMVEPFRSMDERDLRTTALDLAARFMV